MVIDNYTITADRIIYFPALAVFTRSLKAFEALASFNLLQLPSASTLRTYVRANREAPGEVEAQLQRERTSYDARIKEHLSAKKPSPPLSKGALIIDEVKVAAKMHWNSKDDSFVGHAMTPEELCTLQVSIFM